MAAKKKSGSGLRTVMAAAAGTAGTEGLIELIDRLGLVDIVIERVKARVDETDLDELFEDIKDYLKRNPEVLVVSLGALTVATGILVYLNSRREWDGADRRGTGHTRAAASAGRVRRAS